jgi:hypothetical protein
MPRPTWSDADRADLAGRGVPLERIEDALAALARPAAPLRLVRPCILGDGIRRLAPGEHAALEERWREAAEGGRVSKFVPASGAATRMFAALRWWRQRGDLASLAALREAAAVEPMAAQALAAVEGWDRLPLGSLPTFLVELEAGGDVPKGLVPFHRAADGARTAFEEHLVEGVEYLRAGGTAACRMHFSVAPEHLARFRAVLEARRGSLEARLGVRLQVGFSTQARDTDTLAVGLDGRPVRLPDGRLLLLPSGHGALLPNLAACGGDLVVIKNIDNVLPEGRQRVVVRWQRLLVGELVRLQEAASRHRARVAAARDDRDPSVAEAVAFLAGAFGVEPLAATRDGRAGASLTAWARDRLDRPLRVCGMVPAAGEPGGGPFWVRDGEGGLSPQIVEAAQVADEASQRAVWRAATHFNPVDLACGLRDGAGRPYELQRWVDPATAFVATRSWNGMPVRTLERPGLWNGSMAGWNTAFVEIPVETFAPVKTVLDLLRPEHQNGPARS